MMTRKELIAGAAAFALSTRLAIRASCVRHAATNLCENIRIVEHKGQSLLT